MKSDREKWNISRFEHSHISLTPRLIDSKRYSDVTSKVRSKKNAPTIIVAAKVEVLLKRALYTLPAIPAILLI